MAELSFDPFPLLASSRVMLRALANTDAAAISALRSDDAVNQHLSRSGHCSIEEAGAFINKISAGIAAGDAIYWVIALVPDRTFAGTICLWNIDPAKHEAEIGFELMPRYQGKGLMQDAVELVLAYAFGDMQMEKIIAVTTVANAASIKVLLRNGFTKDDNIHIEPEPGENILTGYSLSKKK